MTPIYALEVLKNRTAALSLNHKIGSRDIAKQEVKEIVISIKTYVIPTLKNALANYEQLQRDVKRYFELESNYQKSSHEYHEMEYIKNKLIEVGKEDE